MILRFYMLRGLVQGEEAGSLVGTAWKSRLCNTTD